MIEREVASNRGGVPYDLVVRARFDLLLPPRPLNLSALTDLAFSSYFVLPPHNLSATNATAGRSIPFSLPILSRNDSDPEAASPQPAYAGEKVYKPPSTSTGVPGVLFIPFCCDWEGVNDQIAVGTHQVLVYPAMCRKILAFWFTSSETSLCLLCALR